MLLAFGDTINLRFVQGINLVLIRRFLAEHAPIQREIRPLFGVNGFGQFALQFPNQPARHDFHLPQRPMRRFPFLRVFAPALRHHTVPHRLAVAAAQSHAVPIRHFQHRRIGTA